MRSRITVVAMLTLLSVMAIRPVSAPAADIQGLVFPARSSGTPVPVGTFTIERFGVNAAGQLVAIAAFRPGTPAGAQAIVGIPSADQLVEIPVTIAEANCQMLQLEPAASVLSWPVGVTPGTATGTQPAPQPGAATDPSRQPEGGTQPPSQPASSEPQPPAAPAAIPPATFSGFDLTPLTLVVEAGSQPKQTEALCQAANRQGDPHFLASTLNQLLTVQEDQTRADLTQ